MKTSQREIISERFITLFNRISEERSLSNEDVSSVLGISIKTLNQYLDSTHLITIEDAYTFCHHFELGFEYIFKDITNWQEEVAFKLNCGFQSNLPVVGGYSISQSHYDVFTPNVNRKISVDRKVFEVKGDSMTGGKNNLEEHDKLETRLLNNINKFRESSIYVVESDEGLFVKGLQSIKKENQIIRFICFSDLKDYYEPYEIECNMRTKIYEVTKIIKESKRVKLRKKIGNDRLQEVLSSLVNAYPNNDEFIMLQRQLKELNRQHISGINSNTKKGFNRIAITLLTLINEIEDDELYKICL